MVKRACILSCLVVGALSHASVLSPPPRNAVNIKGDVEGSAGTCAGGSCFLFNEGCTIGCANCSQIGKTCGKIGTATLPDYARTFRYRGAAGDDHAIQKDCGQSPWCAPGKAGIRSPCGVVGGSDELDPSGSGGVGNSGWVPDGMKLNMDGRELKDLSGPKTMWKAGSIVNMSWAINANHGGGYQYRLCKKTAWPTEACFQATPMEFGSKTNYVKWCASEGSANAKLHIEQKCCSSDADHTKVKCDTPYAPCDGASIAFPAVDVSEGTTPAGSTWRRSPIPPCKGVSGGCCGDTCGKNKGKDAEDYQFPPPGRDLSRKPLAPGFLLQNDEWLGGFGMGGGCDYPAYYTSQIYQSFVVIDEVKVPQVDPGEYIMSWRWDVEQGNQIWSSCADVTIETSVLMDV